MPGPGYLFSYEARRSISLLIDWEIATTFRAQVPQTRSSTAIGMAAIDHGYQESTYSPERMCEVHNNMGSLGVVDFRLSSSRHDDNGIVSLLRKVAG
jgi:hypothetical protein